ncbi:dephospho-CoA kinase [Cellvibrio zantedeschiae]|uniref:Dephospho-CoA kinase n=1 Tax=Cellvibrio zantedeschiae TaxID=1237077 RepID=A0ABQ3APU2_9GAMM|nr:dephospho-CoA kinase [Cellvibrio zantedeschiae]GGY62853.1 dephospho-CoA kinase [Cellvibrio zantedeschiae]
MIVGLTGGIGSGKSEVSSRFERLGIRVVDADIVAREVVMPGSFSLQAIAERFGLDILSQDGSLDRKKLRSLIFENPSEKAWLENLLHPIIRKEIIAQLTHSESPYTILSSPLLLETTQHELVDRVLVVDAEENLQLARATLRDESNTEQIKKIMGTQMNRSTRIAKADDIIHNHGDLEELEQQVQLLHARYLELAQHMKN